MLKLKRTYRLGKALLFPTDITESENTQTSVLNNCPIGCSQREILHRFCIATEFYGIVFEVSIQVWFAQLQLLFVLGEIDDSSQFS